MAALLQTYTIVPRGRQTHNRININQALSICTKQRLFMKLSDIEERHGRRISQTTVASSSRPSYVIGIAQNDEKQLLHPLFQVEPLFAPPSPSADDCKQHNPNPANNNSNGCRPPRDNFIRNKGWTDEEGEEECLTVAKLHVIAAAAADRAEMHSVLAQQRDGWNKLFHNAFTALTLTAVTLCGLNAQGNHLALALSSTLLYAASSGMMCVVNKIQPSQLAEEQRMAARLFRQVHTDIHTTLAIHPRLRQHADSYVEKAYRAVLAIDKAYPLPLFPGMLDKFPKAVEPALWWEFGQIDDAVHHRDGDGPETEDMNGWSAELERDVKEVSNVLKSRDIPEFVGLSHKVLGTNRIVAVAAPLLTAIAAAGSALAGMTSSPSAIVVGTLSGVLATVANTLCHGGQMGMVFEMYRNCAGYYHFLDSSIEHNLNHSPQRREQGQLFHLKLALQLGRTPSSPLLSPSTHDANSFAGRLF
eukprot:Gb_35317 [translate_table: standard]